MSGERADYTGLRKKLKKLADDHPAWFDAANAVLRSYHADEQTMLGAIMVGLIKAHELGKAGQEPKEDPAMYRARRGIPKPEQNDEAVKTRISRRRA